MRRADRLFQIVQHMRGGRLITAKTLADRLEVSERTIYRDIADLQSTGVPIDGEAGVGYVMRHGFDLPPLMFTREEIVTLVAGARMMQAWGGQAMARAAEDAMAKIEAVLPEKERNRIEDAKIFAPAMGMTERVRGMIDRAETAVETRECVSIKYTDETGASTTRTIHPLGLWFWGKVWTLVAWCNLRDDFRMFRIDRILNLKEMGEHFDASPEKSLAACLRQIVERYGPQH